MVFITGDCHADFSRFSTKSFPAQKETTRDDIVIVCGDFGIWHDDAEERYRLRSLGARPFTTVFVDGNHENFDRLYSDEFPVVDFHGGKAHWISDNVYHLIRGHVFEFDGKKFWCFGGARSHDISDGILDPADFATHRQFMDELQLWRARGLMFRINHVSWWEREMPSQEEMDFGREALRKAGNKVDFIVTHCCPQEVASAMGFRDPDQLTSYFSGIAKEVTFDRWHFGHYHREEPVWGKFICHYGDIERIL